MDTYEKRPNILHLKGITLDKDFVPVEDVFDNKILEVVSSDQNKDSNPFDEIPAVFTSIEEWPFSTNLRCWSCSFTFDGAPCFIPTFVRAGSKSKVEIGVKGNFCTFNCAARYIDDMFPPQAFSSKHWRMRDNLCLVYYYFKGLKVKHIKPAPPKTELKIYGGKLKEEEFWSKMKEMDPKNGIRDFRLGTVIPERMRTSTSDNEKDTEKTVWNVCMNNNTNENEEEVTEKKEVNEFDDIINNLY